MDSQNKWLIVLLAWRMNWEAPALALGALTVPFLETALAERDLRTWFDL
jgi:hypothetical protein